MAKTPEELLMPRIKVIADWPGVAGKVNIGDTIVYNENDDLFWIDKEPFTEDKIKDYPHLFKKLEWWEDRSFSELPDFVRWQVGDNDLSSVFKVENWYSNPNTGEYAGVYVNGSNRLFIKDCLPATEQEYNNYISKQQ